MEATKVCGREQQGRQYFKWSSQGPFWGRHLNWDEKKTKKARNGDKRDWWYIQEGGRGIDLTRYLDHGVE
jgi:hypothetical protein